MTTIQLSDIPIGVTIPEDAVQERIREINRFKALDDAREKYEKQKIEQRLKLQREQSQLERRFGYFSDAGRNDELGKVYFKVLYDVHTASLLVTLVEAKNLCDPTSLEPTINARIFVFIRNVNDAKITLQPRPKSKAVTESKRREAIGSTIMGKKSETVEPASSSICWNVNHPVWNEEFIFEDVLNNRLPDLKISFTVYNCRKDTSGRTTSDNCVGEVSFPLERIYKRIAIQEKNNLMEVQNDEVKPIVNLPSQKVVIDERFFTKWMENGYWNSSQEDEIEELASICNSEPVHDQLMDPELMDSVSVRQCRFEDSGEIDYRKQIRDLTEQKEELLEQEIEDENQNRNIKAVWNCSEPELTMKERPMVIRKIEGWRYVNCVPGLRESYGELEIGLTYQYKLQKLTISILKGTNILARNGYFMSIFVAIQRRDAISRSKFSMRKEGKENVQKVKLSKPRTTEIREDTSDPIWEENFLYSVSSSEIQTTSFGISVFGNNQPIYAVRLGMFANPKATKHWKQMLQMNGERVSMFYKIQG